MQSNKNNYFKLLNKQYIIQENTSKSSILLAFLIIVLSCIALCVNYIFYQFPGNNYFPDQTYMVGIILVLINTGLMLSFKRQSYPCLVGKELIYLYLLMSVITLATNAIQLTPFTPIDKHIVAFERLFAINMISIMDWVDKYPTLKYILGLSYDTLPYQMTFIPLCIIALGRFQLIRNYYFLMLCSTLIGFVFYYFLPTTAPASVYKASLFDLKQVATGFKFFEIHHHISPTTKEGGLIAMPSFHVVWALFMIYLVKEWKVLLVLSTLVNGLLIISCVALGWHYPSDIIGGFIVTWLSFYFLKGGVILPSAAPTNAASEPR
ncbi:MAG: phosphatase PAP2 family protein [Legionella sp.]